MAVEESSFSPKISNFARFGPWDSRKTVITS